MFPIVLPSTTSRLAGNELVLRLTKNTASRASPELTFSNLILPQFSDFDIFNILILKCFHRTKLILFGEN